MDPLDYLKDLEDLEADIDDIIEAEEVMDRNGNVNRELDLLDIKEQFSSNKLSSSIMEDNDFLQHTKKITSYLTQESIDCNDIREKEEPEIRKSNQFSNIIEREISTLHKQLRDIYSEKFPDLENIVTDPIHYAMAVLRIQDEYDLGKIEFSDFLTNHQIVAIQVSGSKISENSLSHQKLSHCLSICQKIFPLDQYKKLLMKYIESRMLFIAPNLSKLVGTEIATKLIATAGGIDALAKMPACNIQVLGKTRKDLLGFSKDKTSVHVGIFNHMELVKDAPPNFKMQIVRMLSTNCAKAVRIDASRLCSSGSLGDKLKTEMLARFSKIQEAAPAKLVKPLPAIDPKPKKRRGGARHRKMKERLGLTEVRKLQNRLKFGEEAEEEYRDTGKGYGMLGKAGKVKVISKQKQNLLSNKQKKILNHQPNNAANGMASSIAFSSMQGMCLVNPESQIPKKESENRYFKKETGFSTVIQQRKSGVLTSILGTKPSH